MKFGVKADPGNGCMRVAGQKLVGKARRTVEDLSHGIMMVERFSVRTRVPKRDVKHQQKHTQKIGKANTQPYDELRQNCSI